MQRRLPNSFGFFELILPMSYCKNPICISSYIILCSLLYQEEQGKLMTFIFQMKLKKKTLIQLYFDVKFGRIQSNLVRSILFPINADEFLCRETFVC